MYNEKPNKSNAEVALALLESGIIEPIDVVAKAKNGEYPVEECVELL